MYITKSRIIKMDHLLRVINDLFKLLEERNKDDSIGYYTGMNR